MIDLSITNKRHSEISFGEFFLYFLSNSPQVTKESYGDGLADSGVFKGLKIRINENIYRTKREGKNERAHLISARFNAQNDLSYEASKGFLVDDHVFIRVLNEF